MKAKIDCIDCGSPLTQLSVKDGRGVYITTAGLDREERISIRMNIPIPYEEATHRDLIHSNHCNGLIPRCNRCGEFIAFIKTKEGRDLPILYDDLTDDEKYLFSLGKPIEYSPIEHKFNIHLNKCEVKQLWKSN